MISTGRPILFLDVDGPLNPHGNRPGAGTDGYVAHHLKPTRWAERFERPVADVEPRRVELHPGHGAALLELPYDIVWATTWMSDANRYIGPRIGLPHRPFVDFEDADVFGAGPEDLCWKTVSLVTYAWSRPFAWVDDDITTADQHWIDKYHRAPGLAHWIDPHVGLTPADFATLTTWAENLTTAA